jgi:hypothetical protein
MHEESCPHLDAVATLRPALAYECEDCVRMGGQWVHLRTCQECGVTRCCDQSPNRHARKHAASSGHPVVASAEPGERWLFCFEDDVFLDY